MQESEGHGALQRRIWPCRRESPSPRLPVALGISSYAVEQFSLDLKVDVSSIPSI